ncbi:MULTISPECIES: RtcB family protein [Psychrilyobacter]|uniref:3'-phosphate/5'-hydroxy nucleic acid ligase n=1 Tax=Psychrilyobacter piezotolerans TaxID=2293438 RepID=A0ABX9KII9_9FUSO|nr:MULTISPECIES: RtcB family protein [Psychrilyobacter]MCS5420621.1 RtcB family protein [Psychrilyobacter sp. S5]NDI77360.1 RtcB family protein [Psychrilyobacter piezotolerans]RDE63666.1 RNA-splicing ligase RtcB [Psychrilyobacter sp. S5]REI42010.1 RNA-splicing ligase RtcB [Psychrilyobacter piezotolerans]
MNIKGQFNTAKVFIEDLEDDCIQQIKKICDLKIFSKNKIRVMPDVHSGKGSVIGLTMACSPSPDFVIPNIIGVDIGCGVTVLELEDIEIDFSSLDNFIRREIPHGHDVNKSWKEENFSRQFIKKIQLLSDKTNTDFDRHMSSVGSLGSGNHFIEVSKDRRGQKYLLVHSGSRHLGHQTAQYHQRVAERHCSEEVPRDLKYLEGKNVSEYLEDMKICQSFATLNRLFMVLRIARHLDLDTSYISYIKKGISLALDGRPLYLLGKEVPLWESVHNYFNFEDYVLRKGAVSAHRKEKLIIPLNMRDGSIVARGKGSPDWNFSAPHGAGRVLSRRKAKDLLNMDEFKESMKEIYTTSVSRGTLDEAPKAYKSKDEIIPLLDPCVEIIDEIIPLYNFKA